MPAKTDKGEFLMPPFGVRLRVVARSFFIQATNNFERMQSLGFAFALTPVLRWLYKTELDRAKAIKRNLDFFNTQPYLASCVLGVVARAEIDSAPGGPPPEAVARIKRAMMGAFGGLGDSLFWAVYLPLAALLALIAYIAFPGSFLVGVFVGLVFYNALHFWVRFYFFERGLRDGPGVVEFLKKLRLPRWVTAFGYVTAFVLGVYAVMVYRYLAAGAPDAVSLVLFAGVAVGVAAGGRFVGRLSPSALWYATIMICLLAGILI